MTHIQRRSSDTEAGVYCCIFDGLAGWVTATQSVPRLFTRLDLDHAAQRSIDSSTSLDFVSGARLQGAAVIVVGKDLPSEGSLHNLADNYETAFIFLTFRFIWGGLNEAIISL